MSQCDYGCGQEGIYKIGKKWCCVEKWHRCPAMKKKISNATVGKHLDNHAQPFETNELCSFGCGKIAEFKYKNGQLCCSNDWHKCSGQYENISSRSSEIWKDEEKRKKLSENHKLLDLVAKAVPITAEDKICKYCGEKANFWFKTNDVYCCSDRIERCSIMRHEISDRSKKLWNDPEFRDKVISSQIYDEERIKKQSDSLKKYCESHKDEVLKRCRKVAENRKGKSLEEWLGSKEKADEYRLKKSLERKGKSFDEIYGKERAEEISKKISENNIGKKISNETKDIMSIKKKEQWKDPNVSYNQKEWREMKGRNSKARWQDPEFCRKMQESFHIRPNKPETLLINLFSELQLNYKYVGDFSVIINGKSPDFVDEEKKLVIEFFGSWWHGEKYRNDGISNENHTQQRIEHFQQQGYKCLIIWETELQEHLQETINKILEFSCNTQL